MTTPAPPLTEEELSALEELDRACQSATTTNLMTRLLAQSRRALALESELAQLRREKAERDLDRLAIEASIVAEDTRRELAALRALEQHVRSMPPHTEIKGLAIALQAALDALLKAIDEARK